MGISQWGTALWKDIYQNVFEANRWILYLEGLGVTLQLTVGAIILGTLLGILVYFMRASRFRVLRGIGYVYVDVIRGTPMVLQLLIIYFIVFGSIKIDQRIAAIVAFGINSGAYVSEIVRAGIEAVDKGQTEAGRSLGLKHFETMAFIVMPQAVKNIFPTYVNEFIVLIKETAIVGYISLTDLTKVYSVIQSRTYSGFTPLIVSGIIYYLIVKILTICLKQVERKLKTSDNR